MTHRVGAACEAIGNGLWQHDFAAFLESARGIADDPACSDILLCFGGESDQPIILVARQYGEIIATRGVDELDIALCATAFCHGVISVVDIAAVSDRVNCDSVGFHREQDAPVARAQPHSGCAFERFHIANATLRERLQFEARSDRE
jgi:hypothetical protein